MPMVEVGEGVRLHYREVGQGNPLLFLHGYACSMDVWDHQVLELSRDYRCITLDLRGHGDSDKPDSAYSLEELAGDIGAVVEQLDLHNLVLVGHSIGAALALLFLLDGHGAARTRKAVLAGASITRYTATAEQPWGPDEATAQASLAALRTAYAEVLHAFVDSCLPAQGFPGARARLLAAALRLPLFAAYRFGEAMAAFDMRARLSSVPVPVALLHGRDDGIVDPRWIEYSAARLPDCRVAWMDECGHFPMIEQPAAFNSCLRAVLEA